MSHLSKEGFERSMQIAEFAAQRGEDRRQYEFKIFISYITLLVLGVHESHHIEVSDDDDFYKWYGLALLFLMHLFYVLWTLSLSVANRNDSNRRNFYLKKAECISECLLKGVDNSLCGKIESDYNSKKPERIRIVPKAFGALKHGDQIWINYATTFQVVLPSVIFSVLVHILFKKYYLTIIPLLFLYIILVLSYVYCKISKGGYSQEKHTCRTAEASET